MKTQEIVSIIALFMLVLGGGIFGVNSSDRLTAQSYDVEIVHEYQIIETELSKTNPLVDDKRVDLNTEAPYNTKKNTEPFDIGE